jgi:hypothetical protein
MLTPEKWKSYRKTPSLRKRSTAVTTTTQLNGSHRSEKPKLTESLTGMHYEKDSETAQATKCPCMVRSDLIATDEIVRKLSTCVSFYGNFVVMPALKETLENIAKVSKNIKLNYWSEIMAFIDSYDLPYTEATDKNLIDDLMNKITEFVKKEHILPNEWQKIMCTLPDDSTSKLDHRLSASVIDEIDYAAKHDQLPFDLSKPIAKLLKSARKHAQEYIRHA